MKIYHFESIDEVNNVMSQLPLQGRRLESGISLKARDDGNGFELLVPDEWNNAVKTADPAVFFPELRFSNISDVQFARGLWKRDVITFDEAAAFVKTGTLPQKLADIVTQFPEDQRDDVTLLLVGSTEFRLANPLVKDIATRFGWSEEQLIDFWNFAGSL
jgi:hypothetical protein